MDTKRAIAVLEVHKILAPTEEILEATDMAINALCLTEKRTPDLEGDGYSDGHLVYDTRICPNCQSRYEMEYKEHDHCPKCGQAINWEGIKDEENKKQEQTEE